MTEAPIIGRFDPPTREEMDCGLRSAETTTALIGGKADAE